jgi:hypothetical protein
MVIVGDGHGDRGRLGRPTDRGFDQGLSRNSGCAGFNSAQSQLTSAGATMAAPRNSTRIVFGKRFFSLVETAMAFLILGIVIGGIYTSIIMANRMILSAECHQEAQFLACDEAWRLYQFSYDHLLNHYSPTAEAVDTDMVLFRYNGLIRTAVVPVGDHVEIQVRLDWDNPAAPGRNSSEFYTVERHNTLRSGDAIP